MSTMANYLPLFSTLVFVGLANAMLYVKEVSVSPESKIKINFVDKGMGKNGKQIVDFDFEIPEPIDDTYTAQLTVYKDADGKWEQVYNIPKKLKACKSMEFFMGNIWHEVQKLNNRQPGECPIQGKMAVKDYEIDSSHIKIGIVPKGKLNVTVEVRDKDQNIVTCEYYILNNDM